MYLSPSRKMVHRSVNAVYISDTSLVFITKLKRNPKSPYGRILLMTTYPLKPNKHSLKLWLAPYLFMIIQNRCFLISLSLV